MLLSISYIAAGLLILVAGGEVLLRGAVKLAEHFKLTPAVIGLTVVAAGTSVPELAVSWVAAWKNQADIAVGNVVGSNIANIALILGLTALIRPIPIVGNTVKLEYPVMLIVTLLFAALANDGAIGRLDAALMIAVYVCFTAYLIRVVRKELTPQERQQLKDEVVGIEREVDAPASNKLWLPISLTATGIVLLALGAEVTVASAVDIGRALGLSERVIGLTIVSIGTSLPEIITSLVSSLRGRSDVAIGNVIGSNIFNILGILGLTAIISPLGVSPSILSGDSWWLLVCTALLFPIMRTGFVITRREGGVLLAFYFVYLVQLLVS